MHRLGFSVDTAVVPASIVLASEAHYEHPSMSYWQHVKSQSSREDHYCYPCLVIYCHLQQ